MKRAATILSFSAMLFGWTAGAKEVGRASVLAIPSMPSAPLGAVGHFLCSAHCGFIAQPTDNYQGATLVLMMATGGTGTDAFASLQNKCNAVAANNPNLRIGLYVAFNIQTNEGCTDGCNIVGTGTPATQELACVSL